MARKSGRRKHRRMTQNNDSPAQTPLEIDLTKIPPLLDADGVRKKLAPISRTTLYELATLGEIETASLGLGRGRRVFVTASVVAWLQRRMEATKRPKLAPRQNAEKPNASGETSTGGGWGAGQR